MLADEVREIVDEAKKPGVFNIINVINERAYPIEEVDIYLNEDLAYKASKVKEKLEALKFSVNRKDSEEVVLQRESEIEKVSNELNAIIERLVEHKYVFTLRGISEGQREKLFNKSVESYPIEYSEKRDELTGEVVKEELENKERNRLFTNMLWSAYIEKITAPDGSVQYSLSLDDIVQLREGLPLASVGKINEAIEKLRIATATFMFEVDEDFLAKS